MRDLRTRGDQFVNTTVVGCGGCGIAEFVVAWFSFKKLYTCRNLNLATCDQRSIAIAMADGQRHVNILTVD